MNLSEYEAMYPQYTFNFDAPMSLQTRIYNVGELSTLPAELSSIVKRVPRAGRVKPNRNQTKTHFQCLTCNRVLRNDFFLIPPSLQKNNNIYSYCNECRKKKMKEYHEEKDDNRIQRREIVWRYLAPRCVVCGFNGSIYAMDMHHVDGKDFRVSDLITWLTNPTYIHHHNIERLLSEASRCVPLCANCHRMVHANEVPLLKLEPLRYDAEELTKLLVQQDTAPFQYCLV